MAAVAAAVAPAAPAMAVVAAVVTVEAVAVAVFAAVSRGVVVYCGVWCDVGAVAEAAVGEVRAELALRRLVDCKFGPRKCNAQYI